MKKLFLLTSVFTLLVFHVSSQNKFSDWEKIYSDAQLTVEVSFSISESACSKNVKLNKYRYRVNGNLYTEPKYINWKMIFRDCEGNAVYLLNSLNIGIGGETNKVVEDNSYSFEGNFLSEKLRVYQLRVAQNPYVNTSPQPLPNDWGIGIISASISGRPRLCKGESAFLTSAAKDTTSNILYEWQTSTDGKTWNKIDGANTSTFRTPDLAVLTFYRLVCIDELTKLQMTTNEIRIEVVEPVVNITGSNFVCNGGVAVLKAVTSDFVTGGTYRWQTSADKNTWHEITDAKTENFSSAPLSANTFFRCYYKPGSGYCAETVSMPFQISITPAPVVTATADEIICDGGTSNLSASVTQLFTGTYQWQSSEDTSDFINFKTGTTSSYTTPPLYHHTNFRAVFTSTASGCPPVNSNIVITKVLETPKVTAKGTATIGGEKSMTIKAEGKWSGGEGNYQWQESNTGQRWTDIANANTSVYKTPKITSTTFYRCIYRSPQSNCEGISDAVSINMREKKEKLSEYSLKPHWDIRSHNPKKLLHLGIDAGLGFNYQPMRAARTEFADSAVTLNAKALGLHGSFIFHPVFKEYFSLGFNLSGDVGSTPLLLGGGKGKHKGVSVKESYLFSNLNAGTEIAFGFWAVKMILKYNLNFQTHNLNRTETASTETKTFSINQGLRKEVIGVGFRIGPYAAKQKHKNPYCADAIFTVSNDYNFKYGGNWNYRSISGWQLGFETGLWFQSYMRFAFGMSVYDGGVSHLFPDTKSHPSFHLSLAYARDWFR